MPQEFKFKKDVYRLTHTQAFARTSHRATLPFGRTKNYLHYPNNINRDIVFTRLNAAAFIKLLAFLMRGLFKGGIYSRAAFISKSCFLNH